MYNEIISSISGAVASEVSDKIPTCTGLIISGIVIGLMLSIITIWWRKIGLAVFITILLAGFIGIYHEFDLILLAINEVGYVYGISIVVFILEITIPFIACVKLTKYVRQVDVPFV